MSRIHEKGLEMWFKRRFKAFSGCEDLKDLKRINFLVKNLTLDSNLPVTPGDLTLTYL